MVSAGIGQLESGLISKGGPNSVFCLLIYHRNRH